MASVVDIKAVSYDVCGIVQMVSSGFKAKVPPGECRLSALAAKPESAPGLLFLPPHVDVLVNSPVLNIQFHQVFFLRSRKVKHTSPEEVSGEEKWCWEKRFLDLDVATEDVKGISFVQKGYWVKIISTHDVDAYMTQSDGSHVNLKIKKGSQQICVESPGMHELHFVNSCILFGSSSTQIDTSNPSPIYLRGEKYLLKGQIHVNSSLLSGVDELPENMLVNIVNNEGILLEGTIARLVTTGDDQASAAVYEYSVWANPGEKLTFTPQDSRYIYIVVISLGNFVLLINHLSND
ncbi:hypothetical protein U1Q18_021284 [Sarracenia purpurea var. burkii]